MNAISALRHRIKQDGSATISVDEFNQLQAEWIVRARIETVSATDLDSRMIAAGMIPVSEMLEKDFLGPFGVHTGVVDMDTFESWLKMRFEEMLRARVSIELDKKPEEDEMFEWYFAHAAAFGETLSNFRRAKALVSKGNLSVSEKNIEKC